VPRSGCTVAYLSLLTSAGCLLSSDPINTAPTVSIACSQDAFSTVCSQGQDPPKFARKTNVQFQAVASDPDQSTDTLRFDWYLGKYCNAVVPAQGPSVGQGHLGLIPTDLGPGCVAVVVTDSQSATAVATRDFTVTDQPPVAQLDIVPAAGLALPEPGQPLMLPLYARATFTAAQSNDPDDNSEQLDFLWAVLSGNTPIAMPGCPDPSKAPWLCSFATDKAGSYRVQLVVSDSILASAPAEKAIQVASDQLPNIVVDLAQPLPPLSPDEPPLPLLASQPNTFAISRVEDDGDPFPSSDPAAPYPTPPAGFLWLLQSGGSPSFSRLSTATGPSFTVPAGTFQAQQAIRLRVEYHDRVTACQPKTPGCNAVFAACDPSAAICYSSDLRAQWVTWSVLFR
jgi:hypothetical protein